MMAAHRAASELTTHPECRTRVGGKPAEPLPLHPDIIDGRRLCFDPVRNAPGEPWTWGPGTVRNADVDATSFVWQEDGEKTMHGWYIVTRDGDGDPVEITGPVAHDARAVITALADIYPQPVENDQPRAPAPLTQMAIRRLSEAIDKRNAEADETQHAAPEREIELRSHLQLHDAPPRERPAEPIR